MARTLRGRGRPRKVEAVETVDESEIDGVVLKRLVDRVIELRSDRRNLNEEFKEVWEHAKAAGIVPKHVRERAVEAEMDRDTLLTNLKLADEQRAALGWFADTPLGEAAVQRSRQPRLNVIPLDDMDSAMA